MKKRILSLILILLVSAPLTFSQIRFELGANAPVAAGSASAGSSAITDIFTTIGDFGIIPIPNLALFLQANMGFLKIGAGVKVQSLIVYSMAYPAAQVELALGPLMVDASVGGYYFAYYTIGNIYGLEQMDYLVPDLSIWLALGNKHTFRLGGGAIGVVPMDSLQSLSSLQLPFIAYAGLKIVLE
ncbi:MAG: hypothetical protein NT061_01780 [Spirochaetes bacterium]|nr:hypothetical protein [Spirochaetota bacterium]